MSLNTTPSTATAGTTLAAAFWNAEVRDALTGIQASWTTFALTWGATTTNPVIGNGTITGRWLRVGKTAHVFNQIVMGSTTTFGTGNWVLGVPATLRASGLRVIADAFDSSAGASFAITANPQPGQVVLNAWPAAANAAQVTVTPTVPMTWATSDILTVQYTAELA